MHVLSLMLCLVLLEPRLVCFVQLFEDFIKHLKDVGSVGLLKEKRDPEALRLSDKLLAAALLENSLAEARGVVV